MFLKYIKKRTKTPALCFSHIKKCTRHARHLIFVSQETHEKRCTLFVNPRCSLGEPVSPGSHCVDSKKCASSILCGGGNDLWFIFPRGLWKKRKPLFLNLSRKLCFSFLLPWAAFPSLVPRRRGPRQQPYPDESNTHIVRILSR